MSRFGFWRRRRAGVWSHTVLAERGRDGSRAGTRAGTPTPVLLPEATNRLDDGIVVEAQLRARIFGAPVLRIDGTVLVSPGQLVDVAAPTVKVPVSSPEKTEPVRVRPSRGRNGC